MKTNKLLLLAFLYLFPISAKTQIPVGYGAKIGLTSSHHNFETTLFNSQTHDFTSDSRLGVNFAIFIEWFDTSQLTILSQLEYTQRGISSVINVNEFGPATREITSRLDYLSIFFAGRIRTQAKSVPMFFEIGPRCDLLLGYQTDEGMYETEYQHFKRAILGISMGTGLEFKSLFPNRLTVEARYNIDLIDSFNDHHMKIWNNAIDIWIGLRI